MRSYIKIYGPPRMKAIKALEKMAIDMPQVCIMSTTILQSLPEITHSSDGVHTYFSGIPSEITTERCNDIISKSGEMLCKYDFFFEWFQDPNSDQINELIEKLDETLAQIGVKYTITTK